MSIRLSKISKSYREGEKSHQILSDVSVDFPESQFSVIIGKSGCGKSTLLNILAGLDEPSSGETTIAGTPVFSLSDKERTLFRRKHIGFIFQFFNLIPTLSVLENVLLISELEGKPRKKEAIAILERVGLGNRLKAMPDRLSGGEQQRVAIARALTHDPPLILADEPTGNLDDETSDAVMELLVGLIREQKKTMIMVTHASEAVTLADAVYRIERKNLVLQNGVKPT